MNPVLLGPSMMTASKCGDDGNWIHDTTLMDRDLDRYGGKSILVWVGIRIAYRTPLYRVRGVVHWGNIL